MPDFKFSCPHCQQHIAADDSWSGREIACPTCQTRITVPSPESSLPPAGIPLAPPPPPPPPPVSAPHPRPGAARPRPAPTAAGRGSWSGLAIASFVTGICCVHLAAIICGHLALGRFKREPHLKGKWMAVVGLVLGYLSLTFSVASVGLIMLGAMRVSQQAMEFPLEEGTVAISPEEGMMMPDEMEGEPGGALDKPAASSSSTITGTIQGQAFRVEKVEVRGDRLELLVATETGKEDRIILFLFLGADPALENLRLTVPDASRRMAPHVHVPRLAELGRRIFSSNYEMELEFETRTDTGLPGTIRFAAERPFPVEFSGSFVAVAVK